MFSASGRNLSIIVPTLNEQENIRPLLKRIDTALAAENIRYEVILIDDHSNDSTVRVAESLTENYPIFTFLKKGKRGKAYSIIEGLEHARYDYIAYIDADQQYPPEALPGMLEKTENGCDICVANRRSREESRLRNIFSHIFNLVFTRWLFGFNCDVQAGLKMFKRRVAAEARINPASGWTFDLGFLLRARNYGYTIGGFDINFAKREAGATKLSVFSATIEIGLNALSERLKKIPPLLISPNGEAGMVGAGIAHRKRRFITHTTLARPLSAHYTFCAWQKAFFIGLGLAFFYYLFTHPLTAGAVLVGTLSVVYFIDMVFYLFVVLRSLKKTPEMSFTRTELEGLKDAELPVYSVLCPLYRESGVLPAFLEGIARLKWPKGKLDVLLLLEENDWETIQAAQALDLPAYVRLVIVPHSQPKTKPKACNYGLSHARGKLIVIYDAEDQPDPWQLKKAYLGFKRSPKDIRCLQAKLNYYNPHQNLLTKLFTAEYSLWFDVTMPGLQSINTALPLGGTSNHFYTADLQKLKGWDPFNVTEDCDLGVRLFKAGFRTAIIDSVTLEEANSQIKNWLRQRSRWIKGYMQTYLVHMRRPLAFLREHGRHAFIFQLVVGAKVSFLFINPILWLATISYFAFRATAGPVIEALYPPVILYLAGASLIFGNFAYLYYYMIGCAKRGQWELVKYVFLVPVYWFMMSLAAFLALYQLFVKPYFWEKTKHGLHLAKPLPSPVPSAAALPAPAALLASADMTTAAAIPAPDFLAAPKEPAAWLRKIKAGGWRRKIFSPIGFFILSMIFSSVMNFIFSVWIGRVLDFEALGLVIFINIVWYIAMIFIASFGTTINHKSASLAGANKVDLSDAYRSAIILKGLRVILPLALIWILAAPYLSDFFRISDYLVLLLMAPIFPFGLIIYANVGFLEGVLRFRAAALILTAEAALKLAITGALISAGRAELAYAAIPGSVVAACLFSLLFMRRRISPRPAPLKFSFPWKFFTSSVLANLSAISFLSFDIVLAKHFLAPAVAGEYTLLSLVGKMVYFGGSLPNLFMVTYASRWQSLGRDPGEVLRKIFLATAALLAGGVVVIGVFGHVTAALIFGDKVEAVAAHLPLYTFGIALFTLTNVIVTYQLARKNYNYPVIALSFSILLAVGVFFRHADIADFVNIITITGALSFLTIGGWHLLSGWQAVIRRNFKDLAGLFTGRIPISAALAGNKKRILIFNWRDMRHVYAGGAEMYVHKISEYWVGQGNQVTIFCGNDGFSRRNETINGVNVIRRGGFYFVYIWAALYYFIYFRGRFDLIIDCQNGIPFFTPLYAREPVYCLMHHVHQEIFRRSLAKPLAALAIFLEKVMMPWAYRQVKFITVSESSQREIAQLGLGQAGISVVNPGVDLDFLKPGEKSPFPLVLYFGRLKEYKSINVLIKAFKLIVARIPGAKLVIAGSGEESDNLRELAAVLQLEADVIFTGRVTDEEKKNWLQQAWVAVNPSFMEGWGITTIEANACGTPVVASNVPGLKDSVQNPHTGILVEYGNVAAFADRIADILEDHAFRKKLSASAADWAKNFDWESRSRIFLEYIENDYRAQGYKNII